MWPKQIGGSAIRAEVWPTGAHNVCELPHVLERAIAPPTWPMLEALGAWLSLLDAALLPARRGS
jgi:hypothetical protein